MRALANISTLFFLFFASAYKIIYATKSENIRQTKWVYVRDISHLFNKYWKKKRKEKKFIANVLCCDIMISYFDDSDDAVIK